MSNMMQQTNAVLNALEQGQVEACISYQEKLFPSASKEILAVNVKNMLQFIEMKNEAIEHWMEYFFTNQVK